MGQIGADVGKIVYDELVYSISCMWLVFRENIYALAQSAAVSYVWSTQWLLLPHKTMKRVIDTVKPRKQYEIVYIA